jgi:transposase
VTRKSHAQRRARYLEIMRLHAEGATSEQIAATIGGISPDRVRQIRTSPPPRGWGRPPRTNIRPRDLSDDELAARAEGLRQTAALLEERIRPAQTELGEVRDMLRKLDEEIDARRIDRLLGVEESPNTAPLNP